MTACRSASSLGERLRVPPIAGTETFAIVADRHLGDARRGQNGLMSDAEDRQLLRADDTAVIEDAGTRLVYARDVGAMALVCEAIAADPDPEVGETLLWVMSPAWKSGDVDVPTLLLAVESEHVGDARTGADVALRWLGVRA